MKRLRAFIVATASLLLAFSSLAPSFASAFSAYGAGTEETPYRIATCTQLQEMDDDLAGWYVLVANIDCTGVAFTSVAPTDPFTGSLDGGNHTITNLSITNGNGLFYNTNGATLTSLKIGSGTLTGNGNMGSFVGRALNTTLENVHSSLTINVITPGSAAYIGGLVGSSLDVTTIRESSYSGTISGGSYIGGLIGYQGSLTPTADHTYNSFFDGTINLSGSGAYAGGLIGIIYSGTLENSYSSGTINVTGGSYFHLGGLVGISYKGSTKNNFSATYITGTGTNFGAFFGLFYTGGSYTSTRENNFYDRYRANGNDAYSRNCAAVDEGSGDCTAVNTANATPNYFKNNHTNAPLDDASWDFAGNWFENSSYPTLALISGFTDQDVPNSGDANGDGTLDSFQAFVASVPNGSNVWSTIEIPNTGCTVADPQWVDSSAYASDPGFTSQLTTMTGFDVYCKTPGSTVTVTVIYDKLYDTSKSVLRFFNTTSQTYKTVTGAVFGTRTVGGVVKSTVTYSLTDGGAYDMDGLANGVINDPVAFSIPPASPNTGLQRRDLSPITALMITGALLVAAGLYGKKRSTKV